MQHHPYRSRSARNRGHAFAKRRLRFGEITGHDGARYAIAVFGQPVQVLFRGDPGIHDHHGLWRGAQSAEHARQRRAFGDVALKSLRAADKAAILI